MKKKLDSEIEDLERDLNESNQEKARLVNSKKTLELELEESKKQLMQKCGQHEELEGKVNSVAQQSRPERMHAARTHAMAGDIQGAFAIPNCKGEGS